MAYRARIADRMLFERGVEQNNMAAIKCYVGDRDGLLRAVFRRRHQRRRHGAARHASLKEPAQPWPSRVSSRQVGVARVRGAYVGALSGGVAVADQPGGYLGQSLLDGDSLKGIAALRD